MDRIRLDDARRAERVGLAPRRDDQEVVRHVEKTLPPEHALAAHGALLDVDLPRFGLVVLAQAWNRADRLLHRAKFERADGRRRQQRREEEMIRGRHDVHVEQILVHRARDLVAAPARAEDDDARFRRLVRHGRQDDARVLRRRRGRRAARARRDGAEHRRDRTPRRIRVHERFVESAFTRPGRRGRRARTAIEDSDGVTGCVPAAFGVVHRRCRRVDGLGVAIRARRGAQLRRRARAE
mmetsp:Transcript_7736/g.22817  ORF Transcript_7736/g.22817 Transcript_7736/m.22817 type:complete len:239 (-) Transcript_7736:1033-1749(-)